MTRFATRVVHAGLDPDPAFGGVVPPIHQASTYVQQAPGEFVGDYDNSRSANPTRTQLEKALGELEGGRATAFSSGMAGTHALITAVCTAGAHAIIPSDLYGGTYRLLERVFRPWGLVAHYTDDSRPEAFAKLNSRVRVMRSRAAAAPPRSRRLTMPPKSRICLVAKACCGCAGRPG